MMMAGLSGFFRACSAAYMVAPVGVRRRSAARAAPLVTTSLPHHLRRRPGRDATRGGPARVYLQVGHEGVAVTARVQADDGAPAPQTGRAPGADMASFADLEGVGLSRAVGPSRLAPGMTA